MLNLLCSLARKMLTVRLGENSPLLSGARPAIDWDCATQNLHAMGAQNGEMKEALVVGQTSQGMEIHATLLRLTRHLAVFEIYSPTLMVRTSEVLSDFKIIVDGRTVYSGRAVLRNLIDAGPVMVCEAVLEDSWRDVDFFPPTGWQDRLRNDFARFVASSQKAFRILPEFKVAVADLQMTLMDLRLWLEQVELGIRSQPAGDRLELRREGGAHGGRPGEGARAADREGRGEAARDDAVDPQEQARRHLQELAF